MLLSSYQKTEIIISIIFFPIFYFIYLKLTNYNVILLDVVWCTMILFILLLFKNFYINYNILQKQSQDFYVKL